MITGDSARKQYFLVTFICKHIRHHYRLDDGFVLRQLRNRRTRKCVPTQQQERRTNWSAHAVLKLALEFRTDLREMFMQFVKFNAH